MSKFRKLTALNKKELKEIYGGINPCTRNGDIATNCSTIGDTFYCDKKGDTIFCDINDHIKLCATGEARCSSGFSSTCRIMDKIVSNCSKEQNFSVVWTE